MEGAFIINVGCLLEIFSNGVFKAPVHRVVNPSGRERFSSPFYRGAAPDTMLRPLVPPAAGQGSIAPIKCSDWMAGFAAAFKCDASKAAAAATAASGTAAA
jgi:isopenicillin N synthase-like dioxygenase